MRIYLFILTLTFSLFNLNAQTFQLNNTLEIIIKQDGEKCLVHKVDAKQTLYSISRLYNIPVKELLTYNKLTSNDLIYQGNLIYIPLRRAIESNPVIGNKSVIAKPVNYTIQTNDNVFNITNRKFSISKDRFLELNPQAKKGLRLGETVIIGFINLEKNYSEWAERKAKKQAQFQKTNQFPQDKIIPIETKNTTNEIDIVDTRTSLEQIDQQDDSSPIHPRDGLEKMALEEPLSDDVLLPKKEYINQTGIAQWNKSSADQVNSFVMHPTAKINSVIELYNPLTNRTAYAKVIAHIPDNTYAVDVSVLISPKVAERLGALDERFKIKMIYYE